MMTRYYQWFIWGLLTAIITIAAKGILMVPQDLSTLTTSTFAGHEWQYNLYRLVAMADAFSEGMPGRWIENFSVGWGYPLFQFTGPLPYTFGAILLNIGFDATAALNFSWLLAYIAAGISMLWSSKPIFGRWGALLATTCYLLAPYHLVDTYVRTNLVETSAFIFPPLILNALWQLREKPQKAILIGAIGVMLLPLTHMLSTYLIGLGLTIFTLIYILLLPSNRRLSTLRGAILIATFGLALSAFFWLPALVDIETVRGMGAITEGFYSYDKHFVYPHQLISDDWYYGGSEEGPRDHMSFSLGKVTLLSALIAFVISLIYFIKLKVKEISDSVSVTSKQNFLAFVIASAIAACTMVYMTLDHSSWLWRILPSVDAVQFPWRFLFPASFFIAICAGSLPKLFVMIMPRYKLLTPIIASSIAISIIITHWDFASAGNYQHIADIELTDKHHKQIGVWTTNNFEFLPRQVKSIPSANSAPSPFAQFYAQSTFPEQRIASASIGHGWATIQLLPGDAGLLELRQHWHPAWQASVDGIDVQTFAFSAHPYAPIRINIPANAQEVSFRYGYTATGQIGLWISLLSLLLGLGFIYRAKLDNLATRCRVPAICFLATLFFYYQTATPNSQSSEKQIADISVRIALSEVAEEKTAGSDWNAQGNLIMDTQGVVIELNELKQQPTLSLTLDNNERYLISLLRDGKVVERLYTDIVNGQRGIALHKLAVSPATYNVGYDAIAVIPLGGDGYYSLGHLHLLDEPLRESKAKSLADNNHIRTLLLDKLSHFRPTGTLWNAAGNTIFTEQGLQLAVEKVANNKRFEVSLDSNDIYMVYFFRDKNLLATVKLPMPNSSKIGLFTRRVSIPEKAYTQGYDRIGLLPLSGDNYYSLGHFVLLDD